MAYASIANIAPQFENYPNYWLKAYEQGTTTPKVMATDSTGATTVSKFEINTEGFIRTAGAALVIPFIEGTYDLWLFSTAALADSNSTGSAIQLADNIAAASSANVEFTPNGTGAVTTNVSDKLKENVSVLDFGAVGDAVWSGTAWSGTDDRAAIQLALDYGDTVIFPRGYNFYIDNSTTTLKMKSGQYLTGGGNLVRSYDAFPILEAIGTENSHLSNICIDGLTFSAASSALVGTTVGDSANGAFRVAWIDDFKFINNRLSNIIAGGVVNDSAETNLNWQLSITSIWRDVDPAKLSRNIIIAGNTGNDLSTYDRTADIAGNVHVVVIALAKDFVTDGNVFIGYKAGHFVCGGQANNGHDATSLATGGVDGITGLGFSVDDADSFKAFNGIISNNVFECTNVGMWTWTARDIIHTSNIVKGCSVESTDVESSRHVSFVSNKLIDCAGQCLNMFYDCTETVFENNNCTILVSSGAGDVQLQSVNDTNPLTSRNGRLHIRGNTFIVTNTDAAKTLATLQPTTCSDLIIEDNYFENCAMLSYGGFDGVSIRNNRILLNRAITMPYTISNYWNFGGNVIRSGAAAGEGIVSITGNKIYARGLGRALCPALGLGSSLSAMQYIIKDNETEGFQFFYNVSVAVVALIVSNAVKTTINCRDNIIDQTVSNQPAIIQDAGDTLTDSTCLSIWVNNRKASGADCYPTIPNTDVLGMRFSIGSKFSQVPVAGGTAEWVVTTSGYGNVAVVKTLGAIQA